MADLGIDGSDWRWMTGFECSTFPQVGMDELALTQHRMGDVPGMRYVRPRVVVSSIGVLREGPLHAAVKTLLAAPGDRLEVPVGRFVVDLVRADGELVEVQTGGFGALGNKLDALLDEYRIRVVHPVAAERRIVRVDEHGQVLAARRSPKRA